MNPTELDEKIPLGHLLPQHLLRCNDDVYRKVMKVDYVFDIDAATSSLTQAAVYCEGAYKELINGHAYIYTGVPKVHVEEVGVAATKKSRRKKPTQ